MVWFLKFLWKYIYIYIPRVTWIPKVLLNIFTIIIHLSFVDKLLPKCFGFLFKFINFWFIRIIYKIRNNKKKFRIHKIRYKQKGSKILISCNYIIERILNSCVRICSLTNFAIPKTGWLFRYRCLSYRFL